MHWRSPPWRTFCSRRVNDGRLTSGRDAWRPGHRPVPHMTRIPFDPDAIRALAAVLAETGLSEIEIAEKDNRIRVVRATAPVAVAPVAIAPAAVAATPAAPDEASHPGAVTSPMVGVAYLSPEPGTPPFVTVGQAVTTGQT